MDILVKPEFFFGNMDLSGYGFDLTIPQGIFK